MSANQTEIATDIVATHGKTKKITLLHSRKHLLNRFDSYMHDHALEKMKEMDINVMLESRVDKSYINKKEGGKVKTTDGREVEAELIVRTMASLLSNTHLLTNHYAMILSSCGAQGNVRTHRISKKHIQLPSTFGPDKRLSTATSKSQC